MTTPSTPQLVTIEDIRAAAERIRGVATRTPLVRWDDRTWLKPESLQPIGAFKMRGAYNRIRSLSLDERSRGVVTYSSGNHAQAVARSARLLGIPAVICMPENAPKVKVAGVERDGAEIVFTGNDSEDRHRRALELVEERGLVMVEPYDDPAIIAGQGTIGLEIVEDLPGVTSVLVPVSGGGLSSGVATAMKELLPSSRVVGVEPELAADAKQSLESGHLVTWTAEQTGRTMADGLRTNSLGALPFAHLRRHLDEIVTVTEAEIAEAIRQLARRGRLVAEPSGAAAMAAELSGAAARATGDDARVVIVSGGNVDPELFLRILAG
ncbi:MAG TPA: threonine/serine dehydratase [Candidatus Limnocylindrales bacterium]|nr:threonine/serine dehydratase [Candidatus Limnocylindrales bacterium]